MMKHTSMSLLLALTALLAAHVALTAVPAPAPRGVAPETPVAREQIVDRKAKLFTIPESHKINMVLIPAGSFVMGSPAGEVGRRKDETQRSVTISKPFYITQVVSEVEEILTGGRAATGT